MANPWFRLYAEIINDTKLLAVTEALRWRYVALLCLQCNGEYENTPDDEIAIALRISEQEWIETRDTLIKRRLLNEDGSMRKWEERQYISDLKDPTAAERQKRYREKKRNERNAPVTSRLPESDTDTDKPPTPNGVVPLPEKSTSKKTTFKTWLEQVKAANEKPISTYQPLWDYCKTVGLPDDWIHIAWLKFVDRYTNGEKGKRKLYVDWRDVFLNSVKENWFSLWYMQKDGSGYALTTVGIQADLETREAA